MKKNSAIRRTKVKILTYKDNIKFPIYVDRQTRTMSSMITK